MRKLNLLALALLLLLILSGCGAQSAASSAGVTRDGQYTSPEEVAAYIHAYGTLPANFITKKEAIALGWNSSEGNLDEVAPGKSIGGDIFANREGKLPKADGRTYRECDVNYHGGKRGAQRIIYSSDGLVYYTSDHYRTFKEMD